MEERLEEQGWKSKISGRIETVRNAADRSLHEHPAIWAGAAAGAGLAVGGIAGQLLRHRRDDESDVFIVEAC